MLIWNQVARRWKRIALILVVASAGFFSFRAAEDYYFEVSKNLDIFTTLFRDVNNYYVDSVQPGDLMKKGIDAMLRTLDPYTVYIPESDVEDYRMTHISSEYGGIGALVHQRNGNIEISEVYEGFPAQKAGVQVGDQILSVNGMSTTGRKVDEVTDVMKGQKGTSVRLALRREGMAEPLEKVIVRDEIKFKNVPYFGKISKEVGYIRLTQFLENSAAEVREALVTLKQDTALQAVVLDLRGNGGGLLKEAVDIVNLFVDKGQKIVSQKGKVREMNIEYTANKTAVDTAIRIAVLVDRGSASASEIVTGAIQELDRGVVIGQRSFGKGLVQQTYPLSYNTLLKVTIAKYYTPSGRCIQALDYSHRTAEGMVSKVADTLINEFRTRNGRSVFDGSGVYPDVYTDPSYYSPLAMALINNYLFFDYANKYFREHPSILPAREFRLTDSEYEEFVRFVQSRKYDYTDKSERKLEELAKALERDKHLAAVQGAYDQLKRQLADYKKNDLNNHRAEIREILEEEIASRYYYQNGRTEADFKYDPELKKSIEVLMNPGLVASILRGDGPYKVIGKPGSEAYAKAVQERQENEEDDN